MLEIDLLYIAGCPGKEVTEAALDRALREESVAASVRPVEVQRPRDEFSGSPTLIFDGEDPFPAEASAEASEHQALSCRIYATPQGLANAPTVDMLRETLRRYSA